MQLADLVTLESGSQTVIYVMTQPTGEVGPSGLLEAMVIPVITRLTGVLLAVPEDFLPQSLLDQGETATAMELAGPSTLVLVPGVIEDATTGEEMNTESALNVVLVDFNQEVMQHLRDFNPAEDCQGIQSFSQDSMDIIPQSSSLLADAHQWIADAQEERVQFYSAAEEQVPETPGAKTRAPALRKTTTPKKPQTRVTNAMLAEQVQSLTSILPSISNQLESLQTNQAKLESMIMQTGASQKIPPYRQPFPAAPLNAGGASAPAQFLQAVGSPPLGRTRQTSSAHVLKPPRLPGEEPQVLPSEEGYLEQVAAAQAPQMSDVLLQQSQALTTLMAHMVSQDGLGDFGASSSSTTALSLKGSAKRDRLQQDLAGRKGGFLLKVAQNAHRRLRPSEAAPTSLEEFQGTPVFAKYLERHGGFSSARDLGLTMWLLGQIGDQMLMGDTRGAQEMLALAMVTVEQCAQDNGKWEVAWILSLQEEPPIGLFQHRPASTNPRLRAFAPLCPPDWAACALSYVKELDIMTTRRQEALPGKKGNPGKAEETEPKPKRTARYPKKPKAEGEGKT